MADGDGGVGVHEKKRHRFADDVAAAEDDGLCSLNANFVAAKNFHATSGSASDETFAAANEFSQVHGMKTVHVLCRVDCLENFFCVNLFRQGKLDEDAVHVVVAIKLIDEF